MGTLLILFGVVAAAILVIPLRRRVLRGDRHRPRHEAAADFGSTVVSAVYMILLAFVVVVLWQRVDNANADTRAEATDLSQLVWLAHRLPPADHAELRATVHDYATAVLAYEFPPGSHAEAAADVLDRAKEYLSTPTTLSQSGTIRDSALNYIDDIESNRDDRLAESQEGVSAVLLAALIVLAVATLLMPYLMGPRFDAHNLVGLAVTAAIVVGGLLLVWDLKDMYGGMFRVDPGPLRAALAQLNQVT